MNAQFDIDLTQLSAIGDGIIDQINVMREIDPIFWSPTENAWFVSGHAEVGEAFRGNIPLSAERYKMVEFLMPDKADRDANIPTFMRLFPLFLINLNPPEQSRLRKLLFSAFTKKIADKYRPVAAEVIRSVIDRMPMNEPMEFVEGIAREITGLNIMRIMGFENEAEMLPKLKRWAYYANAGGSGRPSREVLIETDVCFKEMEQTFLPIIHERRANPTDDFISMMITARDGDDKLSDDEIVGNLILVLLAGHDTTLNTMSLSVAALARNPDALAYMREHPEALLNSIMELMRFVAMSTSQTRIVAEDFDWNGHAMKRGQPVQILIAGANRDPSVFFEPEKLDLARAQSDNLTFGPGLHHCIGHFFAKMQLLEFFEQFLPRVDAIELLQDEIEFGPSFSFRGPLSIMMRMTPKG